ncbi:ATP-binding protein [Flavobacterium sp. GSP6]|uniref:ATP-binding protein n=1 Tax=Flavobacterium sp. GSP6 TaxID=2497488 RepID=UPI000F871664|nr:ATP-binding protein [Flavobacterium sp. GSP6]RTZ02336.1 transcriptional regulator [Flavobacterium sp. GSP6]
MALPININDLVNGQSIEWERLEFKQGWNPEEIVHTICAFANDINNWGGGYIIVGIAEKDGRPILPPVGLAPESLDRIQGAVLTLAYQLLPNYFPLIQPYVLQGQHILVLWCPAGDNRPYTAPISQGKGALRQAYIRFGSRSIIAKEDNLRRLQELTARIPFDDRINGKATIDDLDLGLIQAFLQEVKSDLYEESKQIPFADLCLNMKIVNGPKEALRPLNVGLLFFSRNPEKFLERSWIELVIHKDKTGKNFSEKYFKGPIHHQLRAVLDYFKNNVIEEAVEKVAHKAEANRHFNFPYEAIEEALSNAVYHKSYEMDKPIEVQIWPDRIEILSFPGPVPPVDAQILKQNKRIVARDYRNRRIGDLLKELHLTEGRGTGFPTIRNAMRGNNSPEPVFETDEQSTYFLSVLQAKEQIIKVDKKDILFTNLEELSRYLKNRNDLATNLATNLANPNEIKENVNFESITNGATNLANDQATVGAEPNKIKKNSDLKDFTVGASVGAGNLAIEIIESSLNDKVLAILNFLPEAKRRVEILEHIGLTNQSFNREKYLDPLVKLGWIELTIPDKPTHKDQKYKRTIQGEILHKLITR